MGDKAPFYLKLLLFPLSILYGIGVTFRNKLFDFNILRSKEFHIPVISVGNITVGGTGKTPHIEYLIEMLSKEYKIAVLSRGYKRKTKNFIIANENSTVSDIGDEPWQMKQKFPEITIAVDFNRVRGIEKLTSEIPDIDIILLDDAFQHRYVKPGINILLIDYNRPLHKDHIMPFGWLRESAYERYRADVLIFSKSPNKIAPIDKRQLFHKLALNANQHTYFTSVCYKEPISLFNASKKVTFEELAAGNYSVLVVAGIANPYPLLEEVKKYTKKVKYVFFPDHHYFTNEDLQKIRKEFNDIAEENKIILTTEKDAARFQEISAEVPEPESWYYIPISISFHPGEAELFSKYIFHYVKNNNRHSLLYKRKNRL